MFFEGYKKIYKGSLELLLPIFKKKSSNVLMTKILKANLGSNDTVQARKI